MRRHPLVAVPRSLSFIVALALPLAACHDLTLPVAPATRTVLAAPVIVTPQAPQGWAWVHEVPGRPCTDAARCQLVDGPDAPPLGAGSLALAATNGSEVSAALTMPARVRLDRVGALGFASYRQGTVAGPTLVMELDVELDAADPARGDLGRLVFEPALRTPAAAGRWQRWDARAGAWWLARGAAGAGAGADSLPCVRARPCDWATVLARFPNAAIAAGGTLRITAPRGDEYRANVDSVVVGLDGVVTTYDFEREPPRVFHALRRAIGDGVVVDRLPADTLFRAGTTLDYAFSARAGWTAPLVIVDDSLVAPAAGQLVMNAPHRLDVVSDTLYTYAALTPLERRLADLVGALLAATDKVAAAQAIGDLLVAQVNAGTSAALLARAARVAQHVMVDPVRDSAALDAVDAALAGQEFHYQYSGPGRLFTWTSRDWPDWHPPASATRLAAPAAGPPAAALSPAGAVLERATVTNPDNPQENTRVVYTNGIWTGESEALASATLLATLVYAEPRFANYRTAVTLHYNPTRSVQVKRYDAAHPCTRPWVAGIGWVTLQRRLLAYARCLGVSYATALTSSDLVESVTARVQEELALPPTNDAVLSIARAVAAYRASSSHVLLVGHSEGVILQAAALGQLPALERHALQEAPRCVAALALAPPTQRASYSLDEYHLKGLLALQDIIRLTGPAGWEDVDTPLSGIARTAMDEHPLLAPFIALQAGLEIHAVNTTYLAGNVAPVVRARLVTLHRECLPGSASITLDNAVVPLTQSVHAGVEVWNQNNRPLRGRPASFAGYGYFFDRVDSTTFRAMAPYDGQLRLFASVTSDLAPVAPVRIPLVRPDFAIRDTPLWAWVSIAAQNGVGENGGTSSPIAVPTEPWDGTLGTCTKMVRVYGSAGNWEDFERRCNHVYTPLYLKPDTLPTGRRVVGATVWYTYASGTTALAPTTWIYCAGEAPCITSGWLEWNGELGVVGRSLAVSPSLSATRLTSSPPPVNDSRGATSPNIARIH